VRHPSIALALCALACARTGLLDFGQGDTGEAGAGGTTASGGSAQTGGTMVTPDECTTAFDCPVVDICAPPVCAVEPSSGALRCIPTAIQCNDGNACSVDRCDPATGICRFDFPTDGDGDGFIGEAPLDAPPNCGGEDCDDSDPNSFPGAEEICDGHDNDCNDGIDDGIDRSNVLQSPVPITPAVRGRAAHGGLVWNGSAYAVSYNTTLGHKQSFFKLIDESGIDVSQEVRVSEINADAYSGPIEWSGSSFFTAFADARQGGNYEVYTTRFDENGVKLEDDLRVTDAPQFSLNPVIVWTGEEYVVAWDDRRDRLMGGVSQIFARRFSPRGDPLSEEALVSELGEWSEFPALAVGKRTLGLAYTAFGLDGIARARFRMLDENLGALASAVELPSSSYANATTVAFSGQHFVVAWALTLPSSAPGDVIRVAYVNEMAGTPFAGQDVRPGLSLMRWPSLLSLGADQTFLVFSGAFADGAYDLHSAILNPASTLPVQVIRLTTTEALSLFPYTARGPDGSIGIVFDEDDETEPTSRIPHFMAVGCLPLTDVPE
jgi:hypothetical protein